MEVNLTETELKDIAASNALTSSSWSEVMLKLSIAGIELTYDVFLFFLASFLFDTNFIMMMLDELKTTSSLDAFFNSTKTICLLYNMKRLKHQAIDTHTWSKLDAIYGDTGNISRRILFLSADKENEMLVSRASMFFTVLTKKFPETIWLFYCKNKCSLWKEDIKFCTSLQHYFAQLACANDKRCNFIAMSDKIAADHYMMMNINAFMN